MATRAETLHTVATAHDYPIWRALALVLRGTKMIAEGDVDDGLAEVDRGFDLYDDQTTPPVFGRGCSRCMPSVGCWPGGLTSVGARRQV